jgi:hypothetical protein
VEQGRSRGYCSPFAELRSSLVVSKRRKDAIERLAVIVARADEEIPTEDLTLYKAGEAENKYFISASRSEKGRRRV